MRSLTPSERRVVELVVRGSTDMQVADALFVSRHTGESHVSHVATKLWVNSRSELAPRVAARGPGRS